MAIDFTPKYVQIQSARYPQVGSYLSGVVILSIGGRRSKCNIKFSKDTENFIARQMPYGLGPENTAYLHLIETHKGFEVYSKYLDRSKSVLLWVLDSLPDWVKNYESKKTETKRAAYNNSTEKGKKTGNSRGSEEGNTRRRTRPNHT